MCQMLFQSNRKYLWQNQRYEQCSVRRDLLKQNGYVPDDLNISKGDSDCISFDLCLECGTIQAEWPAPVTKIETGPVNFEYDLVESEEE